MQFKFAVLALTLLSGPVTGTASEPQPVLDRPMMDQPMFSGAAGWRVVPESTRIMALELVAGQDFAEQLVHHVRTGKFVEDVVSGGSLAKQVIPAGSPAYAVAMAGYGVGWCAPGADKRDLGARLSSANKERCIFQGEDGRLFRTQGYDGKSPFAASAMTGQYAVKSVVRIVEQPVDFGHQFRVVAALAKFSPKQVQIDYWFDDGSNRTRLLAQKVRPAADGSFSIPLWGGQLRMRVKGKSLSVETLKPVQNILSDIPELRGSRIFSPTINVIFI
jgi:hypothetical protein